METIVCKWDGTHLGVIDKFIHKIDDTRLSIWTRNIKNQNKLVEIRITKYKDDIPLIADELKSLFNIIKVGMHRCIINNEEYIISKSQTDITLNEFFEHYGRSYITQNFINEMRRIFAFRWIICLTCNYESKIGVRIQDDFIIPISLHENNFSLYVEENRSRIPRTILKDWFDNDEENLNNKIRELIDNRNVNELKFKIQDIIKKYSGKYIFWTNSIFERLLMFS